MAGAVVRVVGAGAGAVVRVVGAGGGWGGVGAYSKGCGAFVGWGGGLREHILSALFRSLLASTSYLRTYVGVSRFSWGGFRAWLLPSHLPLPPALPPSLPPSLPPPPGPPSRPPALPYPELELNL